MNVRLGRTKPVLLVLAAAAVFGFARSAAGAGRYPDPRGDGRPSDIRRIDVSSTRAGQVSIRVVMNKVPPGRCGGINLFIDSDADPGTGNPLDNAGLEYLLSCNPDTNSLEVDRWIPSASSWQAIQAHTASVSNSATTVKFSINRRELGSTREFNFFVVHGSPSPADADRAPDSGTFSYSLSAHGPAVKGVLLSTQPRRPRAGAPFRVARPLLRIATPAAGAVAADSFRCRGTIGDQSLVGTGSGHCTLAVPRAAKGNKLVLVVAFTYEGGRYARRSTFTIG